MGTLVFVGCEKNNETMNIYEGNIISIDNNEGTVCVKVTKTSSPIGQESPQIGDWIRFSLSDISKQEEVVVGRTITFIVISAKAYPIIFDDPYWFCEVKLIKQ